MVQVNAATRSANGARATEISRMLGRNSVFGVLSDASREELARNGIMVALKSEDYLFRRGDSSDSAYAIINGEIEVSVAGLDGRAIWIARLGAGTVTGEMGVLDGGSRSADARATRKTELLKLRRDDVMAVLTKEPGAALALLSLMVGRLRDTDALVERTAPMNLSKRLARLLLEEATNGRIIYNQSDIAHLIGATREAVNRKLASWRKSNWIELTPNGLYIRDRAALVQLCRRAVDA